jgi:hypothetical protein
VRPDPEKAARALKPFTSESLSRLLADRRRQRLEPKNQLSSPLFCASQLDRCSIHVSLALSLTRAIDQTHRQLAEHAVFFDAITGEPGLRPAPDPLSTQEQIEQRRLAAVLWTSEQHARRI